MGGGLSSLWRSGYLTGNPQITFFKVVYQTHLSTSQWKPLNRLSTEHQPLQLQTQTEQPQSQEMVIYSAKSC